MLRPIYDNFIDYRINKFLESTLSNTEYTLNENKIDDIVYKIKNSISKIDKLKLFYMLIAMHAVGWGYHQLDKDELRQDIINDKHNIIKNIELSNNIENYAKTYIHDLFKGKHKKHKFNIHKKMPKFHQVENMETSERGLEFIKSHEKKRNIVYDIKDGKLTVGYGHAEPKSNTKLRKGQKISNKLINNFFIKDIKLAEDGIKRIFRDWKENENIDIKLTQNMFDALVSIAFNSGVQGVRNSDFIQSIKNKNFLNAADDIQGHAKRKGFSGLNKRRDQESSLFIKGLD